MVGHYIANLNKCIVIGNPSKLPWSCILMYCLIHLKWLIEWPPIDLLQNPVCQHKSMGHFGAAKGHYRYSVSSKVMEGLHVYIPIFPPLIQFIHDKSRQIISFLWLKPLISQRFLRRKTFQIPTVPFKKENILSSKLRSDWPSWKVGRMKSSMVYRVYFPSHHTFYHLYLPVY